MSFSWLNRRGTLEGSMGLGAGWVACGDPTIQQIVAQQLRGCSEVLQGVYWVSRHYGKSRDRQGLNDITIGRQGGYKGQTWEVMRWPHMTNSFRSVRVVIWQFPAHLKGIEVAAGCWSWWASQLCIVICKKKYHRGVQLAKLRCKAEGHGGAQGPGVQSAGRGGSGMLYTGIHV